MTRIKEKLPKAFKKKWLAALRSGDFPQGRGKLFDGEGYCCLGLSCRIVHPKMNLSGDKNYIDKYSFKRLRDVKVPSLLKGDNDENTIAKKLSQMNDGEGIYKKPWSFKRIANYIEKNL